MLRVYGDGGREQARVWGRANDATVPRAFMCTFHSISCRRVTGQRDEAVLTGYGTRHVNMARVRDARTTKGCHAAVVCVPG